MLETIRDLIPNKKIPALESVQMLARLQDVLTLSLRARITQTAYRQINGKHKTFGLLLTRTLPLAHRPEATAQEVS